MFLQHFAHVTVNVMKLTLYAMVMRIPAADALVRSCMIRLPWIGFDDVRGFNAFGDEGTVVTSC